MLRSYYFAQNYASIRTDDPIPHQCIAIYGGPFPSEVFSSAAPPVHDSEDDEEEDEEEDSIIDRGEI